MNLTQLWRNNKFYKRFFKPGRQLTMLVADGRAMNANDWEFHFETMLHWWDKPYRFYHSLDNHLFPMLDDIAENIKDDRDAFLLGITALYHDLVYDPQREDNEEKSIEELDVIEMMIDNDSPGAFQDLRDIIEDTKTHKPRSDLSKDFCELDMKVLYGSPAELLKYEHQIFKEFQFVDYTIYKQKRLEFLESIESMDYTPRVFFPLDLPWLIDYIKTREPNIAVYPGSFDPFHKGHLNVLQKAERIFDKVIIAHGRNPDKTPSLTWATDAIKYYQYESYDGLMTDFLNTLEYDVTVIRGLRNAIDLNYENTQLQFLRDMKPDIKVCYIPCDYEFQHISSSAIRSLEKFNYDVGRYL